MLSPSRKRSSAPASATSTPCPSCRTWSATVRLTTNSASEWSGRERTAFGARSPASGSVSRTQPWSASVVRRARSTIRPSNSSTSRMWLTAADASYITARLASRVRTQSVARSGRARIWLPASAATVRRMADACDPDGRTTSRVRSAGASPAVLQHGVAEFDPVAGPQVDDLDRPAVDEGAVAAAEVEELVAAGGAGAAPGAGGRRARRAGGRRSTSAGRRRRSGRRGRTRGRRRGLGTTVSFGTASSRTVRGGTAYRPA